MVCKVWKYSKCFWYYFFACWNSNLYMIILKWTIHWFCICFSQTVNRNFCFLYLCYFFSISTVCNCYLLSFFIGCNCYLFPFPTEYNCYLFSLGHVDFFHAIGSHNFIGSEKPLSFLPPLLFLASLFSTVCNYCLFSFSTVCNRTFYGDVGNTYQLQLNKPREQKLPFLCHLTFTANGHVFGDIVQVRHVLFIGFFFLFFNAGLWLTADKWWSLRLPWPLRVQGDHWSSKWFVCISVSYHYVLVLIGTWNPGVPDSVE
jgi:hypothetical protein